MITVTFSEMDSLATCPLQWKFKHIDKLRPKSRSVKLTLGGAVHTGIEAFYNRHEDPVSVVREYCEKVARQAEERGLSLDDSYELELKKSIVLIEKYIERYRSDFDEYDINHVEYQFSLPIPSVRGIRLDGKIDRLKTKKRSRILYLTESKTAKSWDPDINRLMLDFQISVYSWAIKKLFGLDDVAVLYDIVKKPSFRLKQNETEEQFFNRIKEDIESNTDKYFIRTTVTRSSMDIQRTEEELILRAKELRKLRKNPQVYRTSGDHCSWKCNYTQLCFENTEQMREALYIQSNTEHEELATQTNFA